MNDFIHDLLPSDPRTFARRPASPVSELDRRAPDRRSVSPGAVAIACLVWALLLFGAAAAASTTSADELAPAEVLPEAANRLQTLLQRATSESLVARATQQSLQAEVAELQAASALPPAHFEVQVEGLGSSFERRANAVDSLRWVTATSTPAQSRARRSALDRTSSWHQVEGAALTREVEARLAGLWFAWAAEETRRTLLVNRLERMDRALRIFRRRLELGEIAGSEVRQLETQRAHDAAEVVEIEHRAVAHRLQMQALLGFEPPAPEPSDLDVWVRWLEGDGTVHEATEQPASAAVPAAELALRRVQSRAALDVENARLDAALAPGTYAFSVEAQRVPAHGASPAYEAAGAQISIPLPFGRRVESRRSAAELARSAATARANSAAAAVRSEVGLYWNQLAATRDALTEMGPALRQLEHSEHSLVEQLRLGAITYVVFLDGLARIDDLRQRAVDLHASLLVARTELTRLTGDPKYLPVLSPLTLPTRGSSSQPNPTHSRAPENP